MAVSSSIFDSFNARALNALEVAKTFVPSEQFDRLVKRSHSIVLGPRGSGKTTLLKMLQPKALENWQHPLADAYRDQVTFTGVFIATDISWSEQIKSLGNNKLDADSHRLLSIATFTTHVLHALVTTMADRAARPSSDTKFRRVIFSNDAESHLVRSLTAAWKLEVELSSLLSLRHALSLRLSTIRETASQEVFWGLEGRNQRLAANESLHLDFVQSCVLAIELFDDFASESGSRWALMFDELELAPRWIQDHLVQALRSRDERLLFKLALNPYSESDLLLSGPQSASPGQDFDQVPLWYWEKRDAYNFCRNLWDQMLEARNLPPKDPRKVLGNSYFETSRADWEGERNAYNPTSRIGSRFTELAKKDASFRLYLNANKIELATMHLLGPGDRAATLRKIAPIVAVREFYRRGDQPDTNRGGERSRKRETLYAGADSLFAISEGNPRWFIGIVSSLLDRLDGSREVRIPPGIQAAEQRKAAERFAAMLRTLPSPGEGDSIGPYGIVKHVAKFFRREAVSVDFKAEPPATFVVDDKVEDALLPDLKQALNAGALVYVPEGEGQLILTSLRSKRFRVAYLLAPLYGSPIRLGKEINLSSILFGKRVRRQSQYGTETVYLPFGSSEESDAK